jgi:Holliday junction resolvase
VSASRAKGTRFETAICAYLNAEGFPAIERRALAGSADKGDIAGLPVAVEAKNVKAIRLADPHLHARLARPGRVVR